MGGRGEAGRDSRAQNVPTLTTAWSAHLARGDGVRKHPLGGRCGALQEYRVAYRRDAEFVPDPHLLVARPAWMRRLEGEKISRTHAEEHPTSHRRSRRLRCTPRLVSRIRFLRIQARGPHVWGAPYPPRVHTIQLARSQWLVIDDHYRPRFLIVNGPVVLRETGETHVKHRVEWWNVDPKRRKVLAVCDGLLAAESWCQDAITAADGARAALSDKLDIRHQS